MDQAVAGAAAGNQGAEGLAEIAAAGEDIVVEFRQETRTAGDQPLRLVGRIADRIGIGLVLRLTESVTTL